MYEGGECSFTNSDLVIRDLRYLTLEIMPCIVTIPLYSVCTKRRYISSVEQTIASSFVVYAHIS